MESEDLILTMHGNIQTLLANQVNTQKCIKGVCDKLNEQDKRIRKTESDITGIRWVGSVIALGVSTAVCFLGAKK